MRGCPSLVGGRPAKPVVSNGRAGSNPAPRAFCGPFVVPITYNIVALCHARCAPSDQRVSIEGFS